MGSSELLKRIAEEFPNGAFAEDAVFEEKETDGSESLIVHDGYDPISGFELVGRGKVTADTCGMYKRSFSGCSHTELHNKVSVEGVNYAGKDYMGKVKYSCGKPSCPECFYKGWAVRQAWNVECRLKEASKTWGQVEHMSISPPKKDWWIKDYSVLRKRAEKALAARGVIGGNMIFHAFRGKGTARKPYHIGFHFHVLGFILGGYSRCRHCVGADCYACAGFEGRVRRQHQKDGYVCEVFAERKTVGGTAWYQLNHSTIKRGQVRFHTSTWFGVCSYRKLKLSVKARKHFCPICDSELTPHAYIGTKLFSELCVARLSKKDSGSLEDAYENGVHVWVPIPSGSHASKSSYMKSVYGVDV
jgi:hypothetical protein